MNKKIEEFASQCIGPIEAYRGPVFDKEKFAELILREVLKETQQVWYDLNNAPLAEGETLRDVGIRIGQKGGVLKVAQHLKKHFGVEA